MSTYYMIIAVTAVATFTLTLFLMGAFRKESEEVDEYQRSAAATLPRIMRELREAEENYRMAKLRVDAEARDNEKLRKEVEALKVPRVRTMLTVLKFTARMPDGEPRESVVKLGLGRCGKTVEQLDAYRQNGQFIIKQWHDDGTYKLFVYNESDLVGRVQECHEKVEAAPGTHLAERLDREERIANIMRPRHFK
ncbi:hypothetical protein pEpSNUABM09_48 [Erwinia phage pEp_SNUABM_09]|uniref:Uncharacterized protein n=1 Tax=Erwinia phage pEp_SNUABM_09 TaxID=2601644 RepID=A0A5J6DB76_9CAUD|nr:hypothetical protein pEpSNUABM09_48 [Erwinia phage pEp_SNUABM_09]